MKNLIWIACAFFLSCSKNGSDSEKMTAMLPELEGWSQSQTTYTADNLYDYINGNSELYFPYGFSSLLSATYVNDVEPEQSIVVDIYDMSTPLGAFGVYSNMTSPDYTYDSIGCEAIVSDQQIRFYQDRYQVEMNCPSSFDNSESVMQEVATMLSTKMPVCVQPEQLSWLPVEDQVAHSLKYIADGFLGQGYLAGGVEAVYDIGGVNVRGFALRSASADVARADLAKYREACQAFDGTEMKDSGNTFTSYHKYSGYTMAGVEGMWFYGAISQDNPESSKAVAEMIQTSLPAK